MIRKSALSEVCNKKQRKSAEVTQEQEQRSIPPHFPQKKCHLRSIPEHIVISVFFSGYLETIFVARNLSLINKWICNLAKNNIRSLDLRCLPIKDDDIRLITNISAVNLAYLDLGYTKVTDQFETYLNPNSKFSLQGISFRGTNIMNKTVKFISTFTKLRALDVGKSSATQVSFIDDSSAKLLSNLIHLEWLNLAWTLITDVSISEICIKCVRLKHLGVQCCMGVTDISFTYLRELRLETLEISGCTAVTEKGLSEIYNPRNPIFNTLSSLMASFLLFTTDAIVAKLLTIPNLKLLEMRIPASQTLWVSKEKLDRARERLQVAIFSHHDQFLYPAISTSIDQVSPGMRISPTYQWPYN